MIDRLSDAEFAARCAADGEFRLAARFWNGGLRLVAPGVQRALVMRSGEPAPGPLDPNASGVITLEAEDALWRDLLAAKPPRLRNDAGMLIGRGVTLVGDPVVHAQYFPAIARAIELLRPPLAAPGPRSEARPSGTLDSAVGRYVHLDLFGQDYRVYFEEAGQGVPVLLQHTAGCHSAQWRHLLECAELTRHFRFIAYDLPYHGKSLPPVGRAWWAERYRLTGEFLRAVPVTLARALRLERPVFMGCSIGGMLALDLAYHHPESFRGVISLEGALHIGGSTDALVTLWHPQVSNEFKARLMDAIMSPVSPLAYRKETSQIYASGWPPVFVGDLHYYLQEYDLRAHAHEIDTARVSVDILSGEYDSSGTAELGKAASAAIPGSTWRLMEDVGHFPMSENPEAFLRYVTPVLERIRARG